MSKAADASEVSASPAVSWSTTFVHTGFSFAQTDSTESLADELIEGAGIAFLPTAAVKFHPFKVSAKAVYERGRSAVKDESDAFDFAAYNDNPGVAVLSGRASVSFTQVVSPAHDGVS